MVILSTVIICIGNLKKSSGIKYMKSHQKLKFNKNVKYYYCSRFFRIKMQVTY